MRSQQWLPCFSILMWSCLLSVHFNNDCNKTFYSFSIWYYCYWIIPFVLLYKQCKEVKFTRKLKYCWYKGRLNFWKTTVKSISLKKYLVVTTQPLNRNSYNSIYSGRRYSPGWALASRRSAFTGPYFWPSLSSPYFASSLGRKSHHSSILSSYPYLCIQSSIQYSFGNGHLIHPLYMT